MGDHRFRYRRGDQELEAEGSREFVEAVVSRFACELGLAEAAPDDAFPRVAEGFRPRRNLELGDLVALKGAAAPADLAAVAGYYMEKYMARPAFEAGELIAALAALPGGATRDNAYALASALEAGYMERLADGRLTVTYKGQNHVQGGLD